MKKLLMSLFLIASVSKADKYLSLEDEIKKQIRECVIALVDAQDIYETIKDDTFKTYSDLPQIIAYRESLLVIVKKCGYVYDFRADVEQAEMLEKKVAEAIVVLEKNN